MILQLSKRYARRIAAFYILLFYFSIVEPIVARATTPVMRYYPVWGAGPRVMAPVRPKVPQRPMPVAAPAPAKEKPVAIGGPSQPEMSSFKSVGTNNLVNLFTGDFSYNIPLLDVGGYP